MVAWFVAVPVGSDASLDVVCAGNVLRQFVLEKRVEACLKRVSSHEIDESLHVLRNGPVILYGESFGDVAPSVYRTRTLIGYGSERCAPVAFHVASSHILRVGVEQVLIAHGTVEEILVFALMAALESRLRNGIVVVSIFQSLRYGLGFLVERHVTQLSVFR